LEGSRCDIPEDEDRSPAPDWSLFLSTNSQQARIMQSPKTSTTGSRRAWWKTGIRRIVPDHELWTTTAAELGGVEAGSRERFRILRK